MSQKERFPFGFTSVLSVSLVEVVASEEQEDMVVAEVRPFEAEIKETSWAQETRSLYFKTIDII